MNQDHGDRPDAEKTNYVLGSEYIQYAITISAILVDFFCFYYFLLLFNFKNLKYFFWFIALKN